MNDKRYILFGAGDIGRNAAKFLGKDNIVCFCDNNSHAIGETIDGIKIISATELSEHVDDRTEILITTIKPKNLIEISKQLRDLNLSFSLFEEVGKTKLYDDLEAYTAVNNRKTFEYEKQWENLIVVDRYKNAGSVHSYFWQDLWAAQRIHDNKPEIHYDIGSRLDGFIAHVLSYGQKVRMIDIRPLPVDINGLDFKKADATELDGIDDNSIESLSALCSLEHFGLGRYGDPIDPEACFKAFHAIQKKIVRGGHFYMSVPIGKEHLEFNAHRVFCPRTIVQEFSEMKLVEFSSCHKDQYEENISIDKYDDWTEYGGERFGLFHFIKE